MVGSYFAELDEFFDGPRKFNNVYTKVKTLISSEDSGIVNTVVELNFSVLGAFVEWIKYAGGNNE